MYGHKAAEERQRLTDAEIETKREEMRVKVRTCERSISSPFSIHQPPSRIAIASHRIQPPLYPRNYLPLELTTRALRPRVFRRVFFRRLPS
jgi:hypothetical protein